MINDNDRPNVWITYFDSLKNYEDARRFGNLKELFTGHIFYNSAVKQCRKMFQDRYKEGDFILLVGDPKTVAIVVTVAEKYFSEHGKVKLLSWDKKRQRYYCESFVFPDIEEPVEPPAEVEYKQSAFK